jgi:hypothetical protein
MIDNKLKRVSNWEEVKVWEMYESMLEKYVQIRTNGSKISKFFSACRDAQELGTNSNAGSDDGYCWIEL